MDACKVDNPETYNSDIIVVEPCRILFPETFNDASNVV